MNNSIKKILKISAIMAFSAFIILYAFFRSKDAIIGVKIKNVEIVDSAKGDNIVEIYGNAKNAVELKLQGRLISIDEEGNWGEFLALLPGYNIIEIEAEDKFGKTDKKNYELNYNAPKSPTLEEEEQNIEQENGEENI